MNKSLYVGLAALLAACSKSSPPPSDQHFGPFEDPAGNYRFDAPEGWVPEKGEEEGDRPVVSVFLRAREDVNGAPTPIDVALSVTKLPRRSEAFPSLDEYEAFRRKTLLQVDALFGPPDPRLSEPLRSLVAKNAKDVTIAGLPGKAYHRDYDYVDPQGGSSKTLPISLDEVVLRTPDAYYVLEYRARRDLFDKYRFAAERLKASFKPGGS